MPPNKQYLTFKISDMPNTINVKMCRKKELEEDGGTWVTINGAHILIKDGENVATAFKRTTGEDLKGSGVNNPQQKSNLASFFIDSSAVDNAQPSKDTPKKTISPTGKEIDPTTSPAITRATEDLKKFNPVYVDEKHGDTILNEIQKEQGFDAKPTLLSKSEFDESASGKTIMYRGDTKPEYVNQLKDGELHTGIGVMGNGIYVAYGDNGYNSALGYANGKSSQVSKMYLADDAKIITSKDLSNLHYQWEKGVTDKNLKIIMRDEGRFATMKGYDAIDCGAFGGTRPQMVILNRGKLVISKEG